MADGAPATGEFAELRSIAARAQRFDERGVGECGDEQRERAERLAEQWCRHHSDGDAARFERRLRWDGLTRAAALARLAEPTDTPLPGWAQWLQGQLATPFVAEPVANPACPAEAIWRAWCARAWQRSGLGDDPQFTVAAAPLVAAWVHRLAGLAGAALAVSAQAFAQRDASASPLAWHRHLIDGGLLALLQRHPVLARQLAEASLDALASADELRARLRADGVHRQRCFGGDAGGMPERIEPTGADRHHHGRQVLRLQFAGCALYYKPRPLAADCLFKRAIDWLAGAGVDAAPPSLALLDCGDYGYAAEATPCAGELDAAGLDRWHRRAGGLLALAWLFNARDLHQDNIIATGDGPVAIDLETLLQPAMADGAGAFDRAQAAIADACVASGLLRFPQAGPDGVRRDASGLCGQAATSKHGWSGLDSLQFAPVVVTEPGRLAHRLYCDGMPVDPARHADALLGGFDAVLQAVATRPAAWLADGGLLAGAADVAIRVVFRPSQAYADVLQLLATPALQRDGVHSLLAIDRLNRVFAALPERPAWWPLTQAERAQLERGDMPRFQMLAGARGMPQYGVEVMFERSGLAVVGERIAALDDARIAEQSALLAAALRPAAGVACEVPARAAIVDRAVVLPQIARIVDEVLAAALRGDDGLVTWLQPEALGRAAPRGFGGDYYLYQGALGTAWMLAAFDHATGDTRCADTVAAVLASIERIAAAPRARDWLASEPCGAAHGIGSLLLGLLAIARMPAHAAAAGLAERIASLIDDRCIDADNESDLYAGVAGLLLALSGLQRRHPSAQHAALAQRCVSRLQALAGADGIPLGHGGVPRSGAAHGLTGIAFALMHAAHAFGRDDWHAAAHALVQVEDRLFDRAQSNWASSADVAATINSWCNGATGILLLRAAGGLLRGSDIEAQAFARLADAPCAAVDHPCCGVLGRAEALAELARLRAQPAVLASARQMASAVAMRRAPRLDRGLDVRRAAGLFRGGSGVALALLRVHVDPTLPSALVFGMEPLPC